MTEEFVRKQDAIDMIRKNHLCHCNKDGIHYNCYKRAMKDVAETPSVESERKKGKWIRGQYGHQVVCSNCRGIRRDARVGHINFCNSCGADMRGGE